MASWRDAPVVGGGGWQSAPVAGQAPASPAAPVGGDWRTDYGGREGGLTDQPVPEIYDAASNTMVPDLSEIRRRTERSYNVTSGSLPSDVRYKASFAPDEVEGYQRLLGKDYEVQRLPKEAGHLAGRSVYRKYGDVPWQTVSPMGQVDMGDIKSMAGEALPTVGGAAGGIAGGFVGAPGGAVSVGTAALGAGAGAFLGEFARLKKGQEYGVHGLDDAGMAVEAMKRGALDAGLTLGAGAAYRLYKMFAGRGVPDVDPALFAQRYEEARQAAARAGVSPENLRSSGIMQGTPEGSDLMALERQVGRGAPEVRRQVEEKIRAGEADITSRVQATGPAIPTTPPSEFGARAQGAVVSEVSPPLSQAGMQAGVAQSRAEAAGGTMPRGVSPADAGEPVEAAFEQAERDIRGRIGKIYEGVRKVGEQEPAMAPRRFIETARGEAQRLEGSWVTKLSPEDRPLVESIVSRAEGEAGQMTFEQLQNDISLLRRAIRAASTGQGASERDEIMLRRLEKALREDRKTFFAGNREALSELERADTEWAKAADLLDRSFVSRVLGTKGTGGALIEPENIVKQIISNPANARAAGEILSRPEYAGQRELVRNAFRHEARRAAGIGRAENLGDAPMANPEGLAKWIESRQDSMRHFFSPGEIRAMSNPARLAREAQRQAETLKAVEAEFKKEVAGFKVDPTDPANFFERTWAEKNPALAMKMKAIFDRRDPELSRMYAGFIHSKLDDAVIRRGSDGIARVDPDALVKFFSRQDGTIEQIGIWLGPQYQRNLQIIAEAIPYFRPQGMAGVAEDTTNMAQTRRAKTAVFGVLSVVGRVANFFIQGQEQNLSKRVAMALYDPQYMESILRAGQRTRGGASAVQAFAAGITDQAQERSAEKSGERMRENDRRK